jgi:hypothetical protein
MRGCGLSRWFLASTLLAFLAVASLSLGQAPAVSKDAKPAEAEALALDGKVLDAANQDSEIMANLTHLSDMIGPRLTGSAALKNANQWAAEKMKGYGLSNVQLEPWAIPAGWERGAAKARIIEPDNGCSLSLAAAGWTPGTKGKIEADVVVIMARSTKDLEKYKGKLKGAVVLQGPPANVRPITDLNFDLPGQRRPRPADPPPDKQPDANTKPEKNGDAQPDKKPATEPPPPDPRQAFAFRRELAEFLAAEGAAVLLSDAGKPHGLLTTTGGWRGNDRVSAPEPIPSAYVAHEHYAMLHRLASRPEPAKTRIEIELTNKIIPGPITVYNTVGEIRGRDKPDEFVIVGAHLDSWDLAQGTTDNGTGTCAVLEAARILAKSGIKPRRTIRFVLFTGEEQGLYGSKAYVQKHKDELPKVSLCLVHDTGTGKVTGIGTQGRADVKEMLEAELTSLNDLGFKGLNTRSMGGSDHQSFEAVGVPGFAVQQDMSEYRLTHHSQSDTLDKAKEADLTQGAQVLAVTALRVANLPELLPRAKKAAEEKKDP